MAKVQITEAMLKRAEQKGKLTLGEYVVYGAILYTVSFFDLKEKTATLFRVKNTIHGGVKEISLDTLYSRCHRLSRKEAKSRYSFVY